MAKGSLRSHGKPLIRRDLLGHEKDCKYRLVSCSLQGCGQIMPDKELADHRKACTTVSVACPVKGCGVTVTRGNLEHHLDDPVGLTQHVRLLINHVAELERPELVDRDLVLRIPEMEDKLEQQEFSFWSSTHTLRVNGLGNAGYNFQLAVALKPMVDGRAPVLAMFLHIKPSDVDDLLEWPFPIPYTLSVLDQNRPYPHHISRKIEDPVGQVEGTSYLRPGGGVGFLFCCSGCCCAYSYFVAYSVGGLQLSRVGAIRRSRCWTSSNLADTPRMGSCLSVPHSTRLNTSSERFIDG